MSDSAKISVRLSPQLQALVSDRVRQGTRLSDLIREALEAYLGLRPATRPTAPALSDTMSGLSDKLAALASDVSGVCARLERLEAVERQSAAVRHEQADRPTPRPTPRQTPRPPDLRRGTRSGTMRAQILTLLRDYPAGLTAIEIKVYLGVDRSLSDVLQGIVRQQRLERKGSGPTVRYVPLGG